MNHQLGQTDWEITWFLFLWNNSKWNSNSKTLWSGPQGPKFYQNCSSPRTWVNGNMDCTCTVTFYLDSQIMWHWHYIYIQSLPSETLFPSYLTSFVAYFLILRNPCVLAHSLSLLHLCRLTPAAVNQWSSLKPLAWMCISSSQQNHKQNWHQLSKTSPQQ